jgi:hypothetical protein
VNIIVLKAIHTSFFFNPTLDSDGVAVSRTFEVAAILIPFGLFIDV